jgi:hypothetical protein
MLIVIKISNKDIKCTMLHKNISSRKTRENWHGHAYILPITKGCLVRQGKARQGKARQGKLYLQVTTLARNLTDVLVKERVLEVVCIYIQMSVRCQRPG